MIVSILFRIASVDIWFGMHPYNESTKQKAGKILAGEAPDTGLVLTAMKPEILLAVSKAATALRF